MAFIVAIVAGVLLNAPLVVSQKLSSTIVGCAELQCPGEIAGTTAAACTVANKTFPTIGLARIPVTSNALTGLSWTEGVQFTDSTNQRTFDKAFYLGTPPELNLTGTGACAVFFNEVSATVSFRTYPEGNAQGTCQEAMSVECVDALISQATAVNVTGLGTSEACNALESAFKENLDSRCANFATGESWTGLTVKALSGVGSSEPISPTENASSTCWPIEPREYDLTLVSSVKTISDGFVSTLQEKFFKVTPILTLFYPGNGSLIAKTEAQVTCMKTMGLSSQANATMSSSDNGNNTSAAVGYHGYGSGGLTHVLIFISFVLPLFLYY